jgi:hypothetical protein
MSSGWSYLFVKFVRGDQDGDHLCRQAGSRYDTKSENAPAPRRDAVTTFPPDFSFFFIFLDQDER